MTRGGERGGDRSCLHIVRLDYGARDSHAVARRLVVPPHRDGGQAQFIQQPMPLGGADDPVGGVLGWALEHLDEPMSVDDLAERAAMSPRTFARRFRQVTGTTPHQWLLNQRVMLAQRLLETTDEPVELVASRCGFGTAASMRTHFQRVVGNAPLAYRRCFQDEAS